MRVPEGAPFTQVVRCHSTGKVQYIHVTEKVTMMQTQVKAPMGNFRNRGSEGRLPGAVIRGRSRQAYKRLLWAVATVAHQFRYGAWFVTLTHGKKAPDWMESKRLFNSWKHESTRKFPTLRGLWVAESQQRGAPHYHLLVTGGGPAMMGWMQLAWLRKTGCEGSTPDAREKHAFQADVYGESQSDAAVEKYLAKIAAREFSKGKQQDAETHTGRTWGWVNRHVTRQSLAQIDFMDLDPTHVGEWFAERAANALERLGKGAGGVTTANGQDFMRICYASTVDFSAAARRFLSDAENHTTDDDAYERVPYHHKDAVRRLREPSRNRS